MSNTRVDPTFAYMPHLDGLRAIAVLAVVAFHARPNWFPGGYIGVDLFFVLSGFLITSILVREYDRSGRIDFRRFYIRRALRLFPALILVCVAVVAACWLLPGMALRRESVTGAIAAATYTSSVIMASEFRDLGWMVHTWSLAVEEYFYLAWPLILLAICRKWRAHLVAAVAVLVGASISYRLLFAFSDSSMSRIAYALDTRSEQLLIGCLLAVSFSVFSRVPRWLSWPCVVAIALFAIAPPDLTYMVYRFGGSTVIAVLVALTVAITSHHPSSGLGRVLRMAPLIWIGRRSYGIYLWNLPIVGMAQVLPVGDSAQVLIKLGLTFAIPAVSYRFVEQPFLAMKSKFETSDSDRRRSLAAEQ